MNKTQLNYWLDIVIGLGFVLAFISGIAFLFMGSGGYQGGRADLSQAFFLGIARETWRTLHTFSSLLMSTGVGLHLIFHLNWIACVTKRMLKLPEISLPFGRKQQPNCDVLA
jgi:hypothetical protein